MACFGVHNAVLSVSSLPDGIHGAVAQMVEAPFLKDGVRPSERVCAAELAVVEAWLQKVELLQGSQRDAMALRQALGSRLVARNGLLGVIAALEGEHGATVTPLLEHCCKTIHLCQTRVGAVGYDVEALRYAVSVASTPQLLFPLLLPSDAEALANPDGLSSLLQTVVVTSSRAHTLLVNGLALHKEALTLPFVHCSEMLEKLLNDLQRLPIPPPSMTRFHDALSHAATNAIAVMTACPYEDAVAHGAHRSLVRLLKWLNSNGALPVPAYPCELLRSVGSMYRMHSGWVLVDDVAKGLEVMCEDEKHSSTLKKEPSVSPLLLARFDVKMLLLAVGQRDAARVVLLCLQRVEKRWQLVPSSDVASAGRRSSAPSLKACAKRILEFAFPSLEFPASTRVFLSRLAGALSAA